MLTADFTYNRDDHLSFGERQRKLLGLLENPPKFLLSLQYAILYLYIFTHPHGCRILHPNRRSQDAELTFH
jgi:hypothetical protein